MRKHLRASTQLPQTIPETVGRRANWPGNISRPIAFLARYWRIADCEPITFCLDSGGSRRSDAPPKGKPHCPARPGMLLLTPRAGLTTKHLLFPFWINLDSDKAPGTRAWAF